MSFDVFQENLDDAVFALFLSMADKVNLAGSHEQLAFLESQGVFLCGPESDSEIAMLVRSTHESMAESINEAGRLAQAKFLSESGGYTKKRIAGLAL